MNNLLIFGLAIFLSIACKKEEPVTEQNQTLENEYHLSIQYGDTSNYTGGDGQWLNIYQAASSNPTPVFIWAHGNGHTYMDAHEMYEPFITNLLSNDISVISWESIKQINSPILPY